jgi:hypothetical protein
MARTVKEKHQNARLRQHGACHGSREAGKQPFCGIALNTPAKPNRPLFDDAPVTLI